MVYAPFLVGFGFGGITGGRTFNMTAGMAAGVTIGVVGFIVWCWLTITFVRRNGQSIGVELVNAITPSNAPG